MFDSAGLWRCLFHASLDWLRESAGEAIADAGADAEGCVRITGTSTSISGFSKAPPSRRSIVLSANPTKMPQTPMPMKNISTGMKLSPITRIVATSGGTRVKEMLRKLELIPYALPKCSSLVTTLRANQVLANADTVCFCLLDL